MTRLKPHPQAVTFLLRVYAWLGAAVDYAVPALLSRRLSRGKEHPERLRERRGYATRERPAGMLLWCHAASVGEMLSILPILERLNPLNLQVLVTTGTLTSAKLAEKRLPKGVIHQFIPVDTPQAVNRFYTHWQPNLAFFCESELWPYLTLAAHQRGIPLGIINGRMSARSYKRWNSPLLRPVAQALLAPFAFCLTQSEEDTVRYSALGAPAQAAGNLKYNASPLPCDEEELADLRKAIGARPVFLAASTHKGEEEQVITAARVAMETMPDLLTILVPRHPERAADILSLEPSTMCRSAGGMPHHGASFYLVDTMGELGLFYRLATSAFIGGSLIPHGGQNPIEAAKLGCPVLHGPHTHNFEKIYADFDEAGAALPLPDGAALAHMLPKLLHDEHKRRVMADAAYALVAQKSGGLEFTLAILEQTISQHGIKTP